jgi:hypothetical protein
VSKRSVDRTSDEESDRKKIGLGLGLGLRALRWARQDAQPIEMIEFDR